MYGMKAIVSRLRLPAALLVGLAALAAPWVGHADIQAQRARFEAVFSRAVDPQAKPEERRNLLGLFGSVLQRVDSLYVVPVEDARLVDAAIKGVEEMKAEPGSQPPAKVIEAAFAALGSSLDPHTSVMTPDQAREMESTTKGEFGGLGIEISMEDGKVKVVSPLDGTPAFRAGLKPNDIITHADGESFQGWSLTQVVRRLRGPPETPVRLTILRGDQSLDISVTRAIITIQAVRYRAEGDVAYLRVTSFHDQTDNAFQNAMRELRKTMNGRIKGVVLDLRNNPGGLLDQAVKISDEFLDQGEIVSIKGRAARSERYIATAGDLAKGLPVVVLVNSGSASASEIVAGALQDHKRALVLGTQSFGKGSVQTLYPLEYGYALRLTTALYYTPSGRSIQSIGIDPDLLVRQAEDKEKDKDKAKEPPRRESSLTGALPNATQSAAPRPPAPEISEESCADLASDPKDKLLSCALGLLNAGTVDSFVHSLPARPVAQAPPAALAQANPSAAQPLAGKPLEIAFRKAPERQDDVAVIVTNGDYSKLTRDIPNVTPAYADAEGIKRYVRDALGVREGNILFLKDATGSQLARVFGTRDNHKGQLFDWVKPKRSRVFVYYVGHGAPGDDGSYLVPSDADPARLALNGYPLKTLYANLGKLPAASVTVVLEACFSGISQAGSLIANASPIYAQASTPAAPTSITVISAGAANQVASWEADRSVSLFTKYFLLGQSGEADKKPYGNSDGLVGWDELEAYLKDTLTYAARRQYGRDQQPQFINAKTAR